MDFRKLFRTCIEVVAGIIGFAVLIVLGWLLASHGPKPKNALESLDTPAGKAERESLLLDTVATRVLRNASATSSILICDEGTDCTKKTVLARFHKMRAKDKLPFYARADLRMASDSTSVANVFLLHPDGDAFAPYHEVTLLFRKGKWVVIRWEEKNPPSRFISPRYNKLRRPAVT